MAETGDPFALGRDRRKNRSASPESVRAGNELVYAQPALARYRLGKYGALAGSPHTASRSGLAQGARAFVRHGQSAKQAGDGRHTGTRITIRNFTPAQNRLCHSRPGMAVGRARGCRKGSRAARLGKARLCKFYCELMRILVLVTDAFGGHGGIAKFNRDLLQALCSHPGVAEVVAIPRLQSEATGPL